MKKLFTLEEFIKRAKEVHGDKYDYSKSLYINMKTKLTIICPIHGEFLQSPEKHLLGQGCPECGKLKFKKPKMTKDQFIERAKQIHGNKYSYNNSNVINSYTKVEIICPIHGSFLLTPSMHLQGLGCPKCGKEKLIQKRSLTIDKFISKAQLIHGYKYDYSLIKSINSSKDKVPIICPIHGVFEQNAYTHYTGTGCPKCGREKATKSITKSYDTFIKLLYLINPNIKCLSTEYINTKTKVQVKCLKCGHIWKSSPHSLLSGAGCPKCAIKNSSEVNTKTHELFINELKVINPNIKVISKYINNKEYVEYQCLICGKIHQNTPNHLLRGVGCPNCAISKRTLTLNEWKNRASQIHNNKYDYSKVNYIKGSEEVCIICPEHGEFYQRADLHLLGRGCPKCNRTRGEQLIANWLDSNNIVYNELIAVDVGQLARTSNFAIIDFIVNHNDKLYYIEYNGELHYKYVPYFHKGGVIDFENLVRRDNVLRDFCKKNNICLIEIKYNLSPIEISDYLNNIFNG